MNVHSQMAATSRSKGSPDRQVHTAEHGNTLAVIPEDRNIMMLHNRYLPKAQHGCVITYQCHWSERNTFQRPNNLSKQNIISLEPES